MKASFAAEPILELARLRLLEDGWRDHCDNGRAESYSITRVADICGVTPRTISRWRAGTGALDVVSADRVAIRLGLHPCLIWGDDWWDS